MLRDLSYAGRMFRKNPGLAAAIIVSIALGIAANTTVFSMANALLLGSLPVASPSRLFTFAGGSSFSQPDYVDYRDQAAAVFEGVCAHFPVIPASFGGGGEPERLWGQAVSGNWFSVVGVKPALGRGIQATDDVRGNQVVVLSNALWRRRLGADSGVIGRSVMLNGLRFTVLGVTPPGFKGTDRGLLPQFWAPLSMAALLMPDLGDRLETKRDNQWLTVTARLKPGVSHAQAVAAVNVVKQRLDATWRKGEKHLQRAITLDPAGNLVGELNRFALGLMAVLMVVVGLVLLIACANVANLLLARATDRGREIAIRLAVGAVRKRLVRQLLVESLLLSVGGAIAGFVLAWGATRALSRFEMPLPIPVIFDFTPDLRVLAFTAALSLVTALLFGLAPALRATRADLVTALKSDARTGMSGGRFGMRNVLVVVQVALSLVLLIGAGLFLRSLQNAASIDLGLRADNVLLTAVDPKLHRYSHEKTVQFLDQVRERVTALPGVVSVSFLDSVPLSIGGTTFPLVTEDGKNRAQSDVYNVGSRFFETVGMRLLRGREFQRGADSGDTVVINQTMARQLFGNTDPIGRRVKTDDHGYSIIGLVRDSKSRTLGEAPAACAYFFLEPKPEQVMSFYGISLVVKTRLNPRLLVRPVHQQIAALDPTLAVFNTRTLQEHVGGALLVPQLCATLLTVFGAVGLTLATVGLYGVMSYSVRRRTREIGIRMALGAGAGGVLRLVLRQGLALAAAGLLIGLAIAFALTRSLSSLLYGVTPTDLATFAGVTATLLVIALLAAFLPAHRAARIEPMSALRYE